MKAKNSNGKKEARPKNEPKSSTSLQGSSKSRKRRPRIPVQQTGRVLHLSYPSAAYAACLANPFTGPLARIPDFPPLETKVARVFARGVFSTSTNVAAGGFGFIVMDPLNMLFNNTSGVLTNQPAAAGAVVLSNVLTGNTLVQSNAEYAQAQWGTNKVTARVVSGAIRIRNVSANLTRGGQIVGLHDPNHNNLNGLNGTTMLAYQEAGFFDAATKSWTTVHYRMVETDELDFTTGPNQPVDQYYMGFAVQAADTSGANPQSFEFEAYVVGEYQGAQVTGRSTSPVDTGGHGAVSAVAAAAGVLAKPHQHEPEKLARALVAGSDEYVQHMTSGPAHGHVDRQLRRSEHMAAREKDESSSWTDVLGTVAPLASVASAVAAFL